GDLMPQKDWLVMGVPIASIDGKELTGRVRTEIVVEEKGIQTQPLSGDERVKSYPAASLNKSLETLTVRKEGYAHHIPIDDSQWEFAASKKDGPTDRKAIRRSAQNLYLRSGFEPGHIYEFIYPAKNPLVLGLGFAVVRDLVSFLRYE